MYFWADLELKEQMKYTPADSTFFFEEEEKRIMEQFSAETEGRRGDNQRYFTNILCLLAYIIFIQNVSY